MELTTSIVSNDPINDITRPVKEKIIFAVNIHSATMSQCKDFLKWESNAFNCSLGWSIYK